MIWEFFELTKPNLFPLQRCNELAIPLSNSVNHHPQNHNMSKDLILDDCDSLVGDFSHKKLCSSRPPKKLFHIPADHTTNHDSNLNFIKDNKKKMIHKEIEKQRRQEMTTLHASLRSLLPFEFIKGKHSISDQMKVGMNYINHLKKNIKELSEKRDELKKLYNLQSLKSHASCSFSIHKNNTTVGIEISTREEGEPLSKLLKQLLKEGLDVVSCLSESSYLRERLSCFSLECSLALHSYAWLLLIQRVFSSLMLQQS